MKTGSQTQYNICYITMKGTSSVKTRQKRQEINQLYKNNLIQPLLGRLARMRLGLYPQRLHLFQAGLLKGNALLSDTVFYSAAETWYWCA